jgi:hypothetical protein
MFGLTSFSSNNSIATLAEERPGAQCPKSDPVNAVIGTLSTTLEAQGDMLTMFQGLDERASDDIEPDFAAMSDAIAAQIDATRNATSDPFGALGQGLITALQAQGAYNRVNGYIKQNCYLSFTQNS